MNRSTLAYFAVLAAIFLVLPLVSFSAEPRWTVRGASPADKVAPTRIVTGDDPAAWPLDYSLAKVGAPCDCSKRFVEAGELLLGMPQATRERTWCPLKGRRVIAAECEVAK